MAKTAPAAPVLAGRSRPARRTPAAVLVRRFGLRHRGPAGRDRAGRGCPVIKPKPLAPAVEGGFTLDDFTVSEDDGTVTCPNGITRRITARRNVTFGAACRGCPLRARCTTSKTGRALILHEHDDLLRAARRDWPGLREDYMTHRPNVERAVAQVATFRDAPARAALPGTNQEQRLAQAPHRRTEPAQPDRQGPDPAGRRLGTGHLTSPVLPRQPATDPRQRPGRRAATGSACRVTVIRRPAGQLAARTARERPVKNPWRNDPIQQAPSAACRPVKYQPTCAATSTPRALGPQYSASSAARRRRSHSRVSRSTFAGASAS